jgi:predicted kinase
MRTIAPVPAEPTLVMFSGLPGTGKTTLASRLVEETGWRLLAIDRLAEDLPADSDWSSVTLWDGLIEKLLGATEEAVGAGESVVVDSVFMDLDRFHAHQIAERYGARFRPVHTFVSDEDLWRRRVTERYLASNPEDGVASWPRIQVQRLGFRPWEPGTALFVDSARPVNTNHAQVSLFAADPDPDLAPLPPVSFTPGRYHR